jgi:glycosyltransferase involved in cell wall biosynthesis
MKERLRILVSAYACSPDQGSEAAVGWGFVLALSALHDLWVLVEEEKFRGDIQNYLREHPETTASLRFIFLPKKRNRLLRKLWPPSYYHYYRQWHLDALAAAKDLHREVHFDLAHQLTMVGFREPGYLWQLGIPFVWGPVGGMGIFPWRFLASVGWYGALYYLGYNVCNLLQMHAQRRPRIAARTAGNGLISATPENQAGALRYWGCASTLVCEVGLPALARPCPVRANHRPVRIVWSGLHVPRKALNIALRALGRVPGELDWELHVLGRGKQTETWQTLSRTIGIGERCFFHGWLERSAAMEVMAAADVLLITSLRDLTSTVTVEALALGLPVICPDHCGFGFVVDASCGIKAPVGSPGQLVEGLASAVERLIRDEDLRRNLSRGAVTRAAEFSWEKKAHLIDGIYRQKLK